MSNIAIVEVEEEKERKSAPRLEAVVVYENWDGPAGRSAGLVQAIVDRELANGRMPA